MPTSAALVEGFQSQFAENTAKDFFNKNPDAIDNITSVTKDLSEKDVNGFFDDKATPVNKAKDPLDKAKEDRDKKYKSRKRMARHIMVAGLVAGTLFIPAVGPMVAGMMSSFYMSYVRDEKKKELRGLTHDPVTKKYTAKETALKTVGFLAERGADIALSAIAGPIIPVVSLLAEKLVPLLSGLGVEVAMEKFMGKFKRKKPDTEKPKDADKEPQAGKRKVGFFGRLLGRAKKPNQVNEKDLNKYVQNFIDTQEQVNVVKKDEVTEKFSKNEATATVAHAANNNHKWEDMVASHGHDHSHGRPMQKIIEAHNSGHDSSHESLHKIIEAHDSSHDKPFKEIIEAHSAHDSSHEKPFKEIIEAHDSGHDSDHKKTEKTSQEPKDWEKFVKEHSDKGDSDSEDHGL